MVFMRYGGDANAIVIALPLEGMESTCLSYRDQVLKVSRKQICIA